MLHYLYSGQDRGERAESPLAMRARHGAQAQAKTWMALSLLLLLFLSVQGLPKVQHEPTVERPFVFMHLPKAAGNAVRRIISDSAKKHNISAKQIYIPCHGVPCETFNITGGALSVIAGHFGFREVEEAGIQKHNCLFNVREPVDRSISCLMHFYGDTFREATRWSAETFKQKVMTDAVKTARCYNDATSMLISDPRLQEQVLLEPSQRSQGSRELLLEVALASMRKCVIIDLKDITAEEDWATHAPKFLTAWFPWLGKQNFIPLSNISRPSRRTQSLLKMPHRLVQVLEELNDLDMVIFEEALNLMRLQEEALQAGKMGTTAQE